MSRRFLVPLALAALLGAPGSARACDSVLLELILARDRTSEFETHVKSLSRLLQDMGRALREEEGAGIRYMLSIYSRTWASLVERYYLSPPPGHEENPAWRNLCDDVSARMTELRRQVEAGDPEPLHEALRASQQALTNFYLPAPRPGEPQAEFEIARRILDGMQRSVEGERPVAADLLSNLEHLRTRMGALRDAGVLATGEPDEAFRSAATRLREAVEGAPRDAGEELAALDGALEALRTTTLQRSWFRRPGEAR